MSARFRFRAIGLAALAAVTAFSVVTSSTGGDLIAQTEAAYTDSEYAKADVTAKWPTAFTSVIAGSAKSSTTTTTSGGSQTYQSLSRWSQETTGNATSTETSTPSSNYTVTRDYRLRGPGLSSATPNLLVEDSSDLDLHSWSGVRNFENAGTRTDPQNNRCMVISETFRPASGDSRCGLGNNIAAATNDTVAYGFSADLPDIYNAFLNSADIRTGVRCGLNSAVADAPTGRVDLGRESGGSNPYLRYTNSDSLRTIWANGIARNSAGYTAAELPSGKLSPRYRIGVLGTEIHAKVMPIITQTSQNSPPYAISEVAAYVEYYDRNSDSSLRVKMYFVFSRSECGVKGPTDTALPAKRPAMPAVLPGGNGLTPYTGSGFTVATAPDERMAMRAAPETTTLTSLPPATIVTSPLESATATVTTTSAPPDPSATARTESTANPTTTATTRESTTTTAATSASSATSTPPITQTTTETSTTPAPSIPSEPGDLAATAETQIAGTVEVDGEEIDVVVKGDTVPTDARTAAQALDTWIHDARQPSENWTTFTSDDPDEDGWRWAAINQTTGTIVYIR